MTRRLVLLLVLLLGPVTMDARPMHAQAATTSPSVECRAPAFRTTAGASGTWTTPSAAERTSGLTTSMEDTSDVGRGTYRLCLDGQRSRSGRATCKWTEDRSAVTSVSSVGLRMDGRRAGVWVNGGVGLWTDDPGEVELGVRLGRRWWSTEPPGALTLERPASDELRIAFHTARVGAADPRAFDGELAVRCGPPPPVDDPARTLGTMTFAVSGEPGGPWTTTAVCDWVDWDRRTRVASVSIGPDRVRVAPDRYVSASLSLLSVPSVSATVGLTDRRFERVDWLRDGVSAFLVWTEDDRRRGSVRAHTLVPDTYDEDDPPPPGTPTLDLWATWDCGEPPDAELARVDWESSRGRPGLVTIHVPGAAPEGITAAASCIAGEDDDVEGGGPYTEVRSVAAAFRLGDRDAILIAERTGFVALYLRSADGSYAGDLVHLTPADPEDWTGDDHGHADLPLLSLRRSSLSVDPSIPQVMPTRVTWDCQPGLGALD